MLPPGRKEIISSREIGTSMNSTKEIENLISEKWPKLKKRAQNEIDPDKLIAIIEEIDDLLFILEIRIAGTATRNTLSKAKRDSESDRRAITGDSEIGS